MEKTLIDHLLVYGQTIVIVVITVVLAYFANRVFKKLIDRSTDFMKNDPTNYQFFRHVAVSSIYLIGFTFALFTIPSFKTLAGSLLTGAGILAVIAGLASQHALSNVLSGLFIVIFKPFRVNDRLTINQISGTVEDITLRHVIIRDYNNRRVVIPNTVISDDVIVNADFSDDPICKWIKIDISYDSDIDLAKSTIREIIEAHPLIHDRRTQQDIENGLPMVQVRVTALGSSAVHLRAWAWTKDISDGFLLECDTIESIKKKFDKLKIEIPYQSHSVYLKDKK